MVLHSGGAGIHGSIETALLPAARRRRPVHTIPGPEPRPGVTRSVSASPVTSAHPFFCRWTFGVFPLWAVVSILVKTLGCIKKKRWMYFCQVFRGSLSHSKRAHGPVTATGAASASLLRVPGGAEPPAPFLLPGPTGQAGTPSGEPHPASTAHAAAPRLLYPGNTRDSLPRPLSGCASRKPV